MKTFQNLFAEILSNAQSDPKTSNSARLIQSGVHEIGKKVVEEAAEVWMAAEYQTKDDLSLEISQLIYHLQVLMVAKGITLQDLEEKY
jgi:phosphoribosyl-ATP pyrophosphohydrolase